MRIGIDVSPFFINHLDPAAFALSERLAALARFPREIEVVALAPGNPFDEIDSNFVEWYVRKTSNGSKGRLWFEQRYLPQMAEEAEVDLVFIMGRAAPLRSSAPIVVEMVPRRSRSFDSMWERLRRAMAEAGAAGAALRYACSDIEFKRERIGLDQRLSPFVDPTFRVTEGPADTTIQKELELPPAYVLSHGMDPHTVPWLLAAWSWVDASVGDQIPLVLTGLSGDAQGNAEQEIERLNLDDSVQLLNSLEWYQLPALYRGAQAFLHSGSSRTGQEFRWALAAGVPIASVEGSLAASIAGEAAYLTAPGDTRSLGAACLTLLVEPEAVAKPLRQKGLLRAGAYHGEEPRNAWYRTLENVYQSPGQKRR